MLKLVSVHSSCSFVCLRLLNLSCLIPLSLLQLKMNISFKFQPSQEGKKIKRNFFAIVECDASQ